MKYHAISSGFIDLLYKKKPDLNPSASIDYCCCQQEVLYMFNDAVCNMM